MKRQRRTVLAVALCTLGTFALRDPVAAHRDEKNRPPLSFSIFRSVVEAGAADVPLLLVSFGRTEAAPKYSVGLVIPFDWSAGERAPMPMWTGGLGIVRTGSTSDAFVAELSREFESSSASASLGDEVVFDAVAFGSKPTPESRSFSMKLFYTGQREEDYAEIYLDIDLDAGTVQFREKDPGYRGALLRALSGR